MSSMMIYLLPLPISFQLAHRPPQGRDSCTLLVLLYKGNAHLFWFPRKWMQSCPTMLSWRLTLFVCIPLGCPHFFFLPYVGCKISHLYHPTSLPCQSLPHFIVNHPYLSPLSLLLYNFSRLANTSAKIFFPVWSEESNPFPEVLNHQKGFKGLEDKSLLLPPTVQSLVDI